MKNSSLITLLLLFLLLQSTDSSGQTTTPTEGASMSASDVKEWLFINNDGSLNNSRIRFQTDDFGINLQNSGNDLEIFSSSSNNWNDIGYKLLSINRSGHLTGHDSWAKLANMLSITGNATTGLTVKANENTPSSITLHTNGVTNFNRNLTVGSLLGSVAGTVMTVDGRVHISTEDVTQALFNENEHGDFLFWVDGGIVSEDFAFLDSDSWADFVFEEGYEPLSLEEVESYILKHGHLPTMPSAMTVKEGYTMHEMNKQLLQVIEEITLHAIAQNNQLAELLQEVEKLEKQ
jgi:hypothetical protein